jgi:hypothetical protein
MTLDSTMTLDRAPLLGPADHRPPDAPPALRQPAARPHPPPTAPADNPPSGAMRICAICDLPIEGHHLTESETYREFHPACAANRIPQDAIMMLIGALALVLAPTITVWAG